MIKGKNCNLSVISIAASAAPETDIFSLLNDKKFIYVFDPNLISLLSQIFSVPFRVFTPYDGEFGAKLPDGNWSGKLGMVIRSEVDLAVGSITLHEETYEVVNFSYPYSFTKLSFMTDKLKPMSTTSALLNPFPLKLWIILIALILLMSLLVLILTNQMRSYQRMLLIMYGTLLEKSMNIGFHETSHRLLMITWLMFAFVVTNGYKALFLSFLTLPNFTGIRDIQDLARAADQGSVTCYTYKGVIFTQVLLESNFDTWKSVGKCLQQNEITSDDAEEAFVKASPGKAFLTGKMYLKPYKRKYFISEESFFTAMFAFPVSRNFSSNKPYLDEMIHRLFAAGIFQKIEEDEELRLELQITSTGLNEPDNLKILNADDLKGAFLVLLSGYLLSFIVFIIEIVINYCKIYTVVTFT